MLFIDWWRALVLGEGLLTLTILSWGDLKRGEVSDSVSLGCIRLTAILAVLTCVLLQSLEPLFYSLILCIGLTLPFILLNRLDNQAGGADVIAAGIIGLNLGLLSYLGHTWRQYFPFITLPYYINFILILGWITILYVAAKGSVKEMHVRFIPLMLIAYVITII